MTVQQEPQPRQRQQPKTTLATEPKQGPLPTLSALPSSKSTIIFNNDLNVTIYTTNVMFGIKTFTLQNRI